MKFLVDLDLQNVCHLNNSLLQNTDTTVPSSQWTGLADINIGLIAHYNNAIWYYGKAAGGGVGTGSWNVVATANDVLNVWNPATSTANRVVVTNGSGALAYSSNWGVNSNNLDLGVSGTNRRIVNIADPLNPQEAATKNYVDSVAAGLRSYKNSCKFATSSNTGGTFSAVPSQATITGAAQTSFDSPGITVTVGMRVLVKNQTTTLQNGIYEITVITGTSTYDLQRTLDAHTTGDLADGTVVFVEKGTSWGSSTWVITGSGTTPIMNTDPILWVLFSQITGVTAGNGLTMTGSTLDVNTDGVTTQILSNQIQIKGSTSGNDFMALITATGGTTAVPTWGKISLTSYVSGILPAANGGTGLNTSATVKGTILYTSNTGVWAEATVNAGGTTAQVPIILNKTTGAVSWQDTTGTTSIVLADSPVFATAVTGSGTMAVFNTGSITVNEYGAATTVNTGNVTTSAQTVSWFSSSTGASTYSLACGPTAAAVTKTINIGTLGASTSVTNINFGSAVAGATGTAAFQNITLTATSPQFATSITTASTNFTLLNTNATFLTAFGAATILGIGGTTTTGSSLSFGNGAIASGATKSIYIGSAGLSGSTTTVEIGSSVAGALGTTTFYTGVVVPGGSTGNYFRIIAPTSKEINFAVIGGAAGASRTLTIQDASGTVAYLTNRIDEFASCTSAQLAAKVSDKVGSGFLIFNTTPTFVTSIDSTTNAAFALLATPLTLTIGAGATSLTMGAAATTLNVGGLSSGVQTVTVGGSNTDSSTYNFATGATANTKTKTVNIGTGGVAGSTTNINIGSASGGTVTILAPFSTASLDTRDTTFTIKNTTDPTKIAQFSCASITTGTTKLFTFPNSTGTLATVEGAFTQFGIGVSTSAQLANILTDETGTGVAVFNDHPSLISPRITTSINDLNNSAMFGFTAAGGANYFAFTNSNTAAGKIYLGATGTDAQVSLQFEPKGTTTASSAWGAVTWKDASAGSYQALRMCRTWGFTLSTANPDRAGVALVGTFGSTTSFTFTHDFGTQDILVMFTEVSTGAMVQADWTRVSGNETKQISVTFKTPPASGAYRVTIIG